MRDFKKGGRAPARFGGGGFSGAPRRDFSRPAEMHQATCANCKKMCEVPFRPNGKKPVFCKDCFTDSKDDAPERSFSRSRSRETSTERPSYRPEASSRPGGDLESKVEKLSAKLDTLIRMVEALQQ